MEETMAHKAPGKTFRKGIYLVELIRMFPDYVRAKLWFIKVR